MKLQMTIQPILVCDDSGMFCPNSGQTLSEDEGDKIWAQAGIDLVFLDFNRFNSTAYTNLDPNAEFDSLVYGPGHGQNPNPLVVNMWFVWGDHEWRLWDRLPRCGRRRD